MKKVFFAGVVFALAITLVSCGANRKLGCPSSVKNITPVTEKNIAA